MLECRHPQSLSHTHPYMCVYTNFPHCPALCLWSPFHFSDTIKIGEDLQRGRGEQKNGLMGWIGPLGWELATTVWEIRMRTKSFCEVHTHPHWKLSPLASVFISDLKICELSCLCELKEFPLCVSSPHLPLLLTHQPLWSSNACIQQEMGSPGLMQTDVFCVYFSFFPFILIKDTTLVSHFLLFFWFLGCDKAR